MLFRSHLGDFTDSVARNIDQMPDELKSEAANLMADFKPLFQKTVTEEIPQADGTLKTITKKVPITEANGEVAMAVKQRLKDLTDQFADTEGKSAGKKQVMRTAQAIYQDLSDSLGNAVSEADKALGGKGDLTKKYALHMGIERDLAPLFRSKQSAYNALRLLNGKQKQLLKETIQKVDASYGTDLEIGRAHV